MLEQAKAANESFPLLLLDAHMPGLDGFTVAARIKQDPHLAGATILMLSSTDLIGDRTRCRELGITVYLTKPITPSELWEAIMTALHMPPRVGADFPAITPHTASKTRRRLHILLAEDNPVNQRLAIRMLEKQGHTVVVVQDGQKALAALAQQAFDLVLMDVQMPEMDGLATAAAIRTRERQTGGHLPIIAMTAHAMKGDQERCLAAGMDGYLAKPVTADELYAAIDQLFSRESDPPPPAAEPPIDLATILRIVEGDKALLSELGEIFLQDYPSQLTELRKAINHGDAHQLERTAHSFKGALGTIGATAASNLAYELEIIGHTACLDEASTVLEKLEAELERLAAFFTDPSWLDRL
jgi:two-component system, sensor histidine kinase and response regulator